MSIHDRDPLSAINLQQTQDTTAADVARQKAVKMQEMMRDVVEAAAATTVGKLPQPNALDQLVLPAEDTVSAPSQAVLPSETATALYQIIVDNQNLIPSIANIKKSDPHIASMLKDTPPLAFSNSVNTILIASMIDAINAKQAAFGAQQGILTAQTANVVENTQVASANMQEQSGISSANATMQQGQGEYISGIITGAVGAATIGLSFASTIQLGKAAGLKNELTSMKTEASLGQGAEPPEVPPEGGPAEPAPVAGAGGTAPGGGAGGRATAEAEEDAEAAAAAPGQQANKASEAAKRAENIKLKQAEYNSAKLWGDRLKTIGDTLNMFGSSAASITKGVYTKDSSQSQNTAAEEKQVGDVIQAQASRTQAFMEAASKAADNSYSSASTTAQAAAEVKKGAQIPG